MIIFDEDRPSDSPVVERIWRAHSEGARPFLSIAESRSEMVVTRHHGKLTLTVRGPETKATPLGDCPADSEWLGIRLKPGAFLLPLPARRRLAPWFLHSSGAWPLRAAARVVCVPAVAWVLFLGTIAASHLPPVFDLALRNATFVVPAGTCGHVLVATLGGSWHEYSLTGVKQGPQCVERGGGGEVV